MTKQKRKDIFINNLLKTYSLILMGMITLIVIFVSIYIGLGQQTQNQNAVNDKMAKLVREVSDCQTIAKSVDMTLNELPRDFENMQNYLTLSREAYWDYTEKIWQASDQNIMFSEIISSLMVQYPKISELTITLDGVPTQLHADRQHLTGQLLEGLTTENTDNSFKLIQPIHDPYSYEIVGQIILKFDRTLFLTETDEGLPLDSLIFHDGGQLLFKDNHFVPTKQVAQFVNQIAHAKSWATVTKGLDIQNKTIDDLEIFILQSKRDILTRLFLKIAMVIFIGLGLMTIFYVTLRITFNKYSIEVMGIVAVTRDIGKGDLAQRVDEKGLHLELLELGHALNTMLDSLHDLVENNYKLEIKQRDAQMAALQSQINPHFLYNTLEYIRMYALSRGQKELSDVVFAFGALLRNNINQDKTISLEQELEFCEKYVYLYQMRYPDAIAYAFQFSGEGSLGDIVIPKFLIQPLIENYFMHGIDYKRKDNAIRVRTFLENDEVRIQIKDNGRGMSPERLAEVQASLQELPTDGKSVGLANVYQRLKAFDSEHAKMLLQVNQGLEITICFKNKKI